MISLVHELMLFGVSVFFLKSYCKKRRKDAHIHESVVTLAKAVKRISLRESKNEFQRQLRS